MLVSNVVNNPGRQAAVPDWAWGRLGRATAVCPGEQSCGDQIRCWWDTQHLLLALADGLGHGIHAYTAAMEVMQAVEQRWLDWQQQRRTHPQHLPAIPTWLTECFAYCDQAILHTRGVSLALVWILPEQAQLLHAAVGNVRTLVQGSQATRRLGCARGIVGAGYRGLQPEVFALNREDWVVMFSDGLAENSDFATLTRTAVASDALALTVLQQQQRQDDDAALLLYQHTAALITDG